ncbi:MAG: chromosome segregation protein SMC [Chitinophagales bacterium]|nr:chromosome segregation protein SMC [Chitinophagales bacterium]
MKLKRLEVKGFKSFADKTTVHFNDNITGIVGPNGCGKSNIVDAIRWVLGEQKTSQLRLEKMDNVLFNGTKSRKSSGLAEVSLSFDNTKNILTTEFQEVTITRRLYRTGESEYRINDVTCRLKDIHNLFIDSGIGSDSYAIIELGMVDEILQNKEQSRKRLFEQASSISKYKIRKKESLQKLKATEENLERLKDILAEIESNMKTLETQAKRAERYYQIKEEYKTYSLESIKYQVSNYKTSYNTLFADKQKEQDKKNEIETMIQSRDAETQKLKLELVTKETRLTEVQKKVNDLIGGIGRNENERNLLREQISNLSKNNEQIKIQIQEAQSEIERVNISLRELNDVVAKSQEKFNSVEIERKAIQEELDANEKTFLENKSVVDQDKNLFTETQKQVYELDKNKSVLQSQILLAEENRLKIENEYEGLYLERETLDNAFNLITQSKDNLESELQKLTQEEEVNKTTIEEKNEQVNQKKIELNQVHRKNDSKKNEYNLLKSMIDNLEGFPESIKFLKKNVSLFEHKNVFSDLIVCEEKYKIAIEGLITGYGNYFIVDTLFDAQLSIRKLKEQNAGKVGLFVMELVKKISTPSPKSFKNLIPAAEVVKLDKQYEALASYLFHNIYFAENIEELNLAEFENENIKIIDLQGTAILDKHALYGGSASLFDGAQVGRSRNLEALNAEIIELDKEVAIVEKQHNTLLKEIEDLKTKTKVKEIEELQAKFSSVKDEFAKKSVMVEQTKTRLMHIEEKRVELADSKISNEAALQKIELEHKELVNSLDVLKDKNDQNQLALEAYLAKYNEIKEKANKIDVEYNTLHITIMQQNQQILFFTKQLDTLNNNVIQFQNKIESQYKEEAEKTELLSKMEMDILSNYTERDSLTLSVQEAEKDYFTSRNLVAEQENAIREIQSQLTRQTEIVYSYDSKLQEMRIQLQSIKERLKIEFEMELDEFINSDLTVSIPQEEVETKLAHFKKRLDTYGEINPMAIETYNEMKKRYDFLVEQKEDVLAAKNDLLETIKEIDANAKERFLESFDKIRENFIKTFRILFTEDDDCDLILVDPENPIDSDIEIIAKPKGKKPLTINQLSGGEKTLTATALLFSLYLLKPAPFCIFDEVDAPLDDTNIAKFNKIIEEFSKNSQFIIVTHNKQTMASVEVLYGVTMIEQGVSRVVPVDFRTLAESA